MLYDYSHLCSVENKSKQYQIIPFLLSLGILFLACSNEVPGQRMVIHEIYQVTGDDQTKKPTVLQYKDAKLYKGDIVEQTSYFEIDNTLKSYEFVKKEGDKGITNYYSSDSTLLAIYNLEYQGDNIIKRTGYDGQSKQLLRLETFEYDNNGNVTKKSIFNSEGQLSSFFSMAYDDNANEISFTRHGSEGQVVDKETFVISKTNKSGKWIERWGYRNERPSSFHRRTFDQ